MWGKGMAVVPGDVEKDGTSVWFRECLLYLTAGTGWGEDSSALILED